MQLGEAALEHHAILLRPCDGPVELGLHERGRELDRICDQPLVEQVCDVLREVILVVREVRDGRSGHTGVDEPVRVEAAGRRPCLDAVAAREAERARRLRQPSPELVRRAEQHQLRPVPDAVEIDDPGHLLELAADLRLVDVEARAEQLALLGRERDERDVALEHTLADAAHALDTARVVDRTRAVPDRVVMRRHENPVLAAAASVGDHVSLPAAHELAAEAEADVHPVLEPLCIRARDERRGRRRDGVVRRRERDRAAAERARHEPGALAAVGIDDRECRQPSLADGRRALADAANATLDVGGMRVHAGAGGPVLTLDLEPRLVRLVPEQVELLEPGLQAELAERGRDRLGGARRLVRAGRARPDVRRKSLDEVHRLESTDRRSAIRDGRRREYDHAVRPRPNRLERLPDQYFVALLERVTVASRQDGPPLVDLGRGNPETGPPPHVVERLRDAAGAPTAHRYAHIRGSARLKEALAARYRDVYGVELDPEREVAVVPGTKTAIVELALVLAERGGTILLPDPYYPDYRSGVALAGAELGLLELDPEAGWAPDLERAPAAAALYLNYPSNPCAVAPPPGAFEAAVAYGGRTGTVVVHDAAYADLVFDGRRPRSFLATPGAKDVGVELWSMSKTYGMAGWRIGFVVGNEEVVERINLMNDHVRVGIFEPLQEAATAALEGPQDSVEERRATYERRRDALASVLPGPTRCEGTFFVWVELPEGWSPERLLAEERVAVAPGEGFGPAWAGMGTAVARGAGRDAGARDRAAGAGVCGGGRAGVKIGIVVPFSWSYWGGVVEHAENQAAALAERGHDVRIVIGHDPPGKLTRLLHPRTGRHGTLPPGVITVGRSVVVPANGSLPNIVLSPPVIGRIRRVLEDERFDVVHVHEPMTPAIAVATLAYARCPLVATWHAAGDLRWMVGAARMWGFLADRVDARVAVSEQAAVSARRHLPGEYEIVPNGVVLPAQADPGDREHRVVFIGRHDPRKGLSVLLRAWPEIHRRTGARLRLVGTDPLQYRLLHARLRVDEAGIDVLGVIPDEALTRELLSAKLLVSPALGGESFGMVLTRAFACAAPAVASDIPGYAAVATADAARLVPPGRERALADAVVELLEDEDRRRAMGAAARSLAAARYAWSDVARRLEATYERVAA